MDIKELKGLVRSVECSLVLLLVLELNGALLVSLSNVPGESLHQVRILLIHLDVNFLVVDGQCLRLLRVEDEAQTAHQRAASLDEVRRPLGLLALSTIEKCLVHIL